MSKSFEEYLAERLSEPTHDWYDADGNSTRATVVRMRNGGYWKALKWEFGELVSDVKYFLTEEFKGLRTPLIWFVHLTLLPILFVVSLFTRTSSRYKDALGEYRKEYDRKHPQRGATP